MVFRLYLLIYNSNLKRRTGILKGDIHTSQRLLWNEREIIPRMTGTCQATVWSYCFLPVWRVMAVCRGNENSNSFWLLLTTAPFVYLCCGGRSANLILVIFMAKKKKIPLRFLVCPSDGGGEERDGSHVALHPPEWIYRTCNLWSCQQAKWSATLWLLWVPGTFVLVALPSIKNIETHLLLQCWNKDKYDV